MEDNFFSNIFLKKSIDYSINNGQDVPDETRSLLVGILHRTLVDLNMNRDSPVYCDAKAWVEGKGIYGKYDYWLSFENVCLTLDLDPEKIRKGMYQAANVSGKFYYAQKRRLV